MNISKLNTLTKEQKNEEIFRWLGYELNDKNLWEMFDDENLYGEVPDFHSQAIELLKVLSECGVNPILIFRDGGWSLELDAGDSGSWKDLGEAIVNSILVCLWDKPDKITSVSGLDNESIKAKKDTEILYARCVPFYYNIGTGNRVILSE